MRDRMRGGTRTPDSQDPRRLLARLGRSLGEVTLDTPIRHQPDQRRHDVKLLVPEAGSCFASGAGTRRPVPRERAAAPH